MVLVYSFCVPVSSIQICCATCSGGKRSQHNVLYFGERFLPLLSKRRKPGEADGLKKAMHFRSYPAKGDLCEPFSGGQEWRANPCTFPKPLKLLHNKTPSTGDLRNYNCGIRWKNSWKTLVKKRGDCQWTWLTLLDTHYPRSVESEKWTDGRGRLPLEKTSRCARELSVLIPRLKVKELHW